MYEIHAVKKTRTNEEAGPFACERPTCEAIRQTSPSTPQLRAMLAQMLQVLLRPSSMVDPAISSLHSPLPPDDGGVNVAVIWSTVFKTPITHVREDWCVEKELGMVNKHFSHFLLSRVQLYSLNIVTVFAFS